MSTIRFQEPSDRQFIATCTSVRVVVAFCLVLGIAAGAQAQSPLDGFNPGANGRVSSMLVQPDGKILIGGEFTMLGGGGSGTISRNHIGRLNRDGSLDASFDPGANGEVSALALQPDGKILVAGQFTTLGGGGSGTATRNHIARLNADGSLDASFNPGANGDIFALALQPDGRVLVGGGFTTLGGSGVGTSSRSGLGRLNADGTLDTAFDPGANGNVLALLVQPNLRILVGGAFTNLGGGGSGTSTRSRIGRLNADGSLDASFNPGADGNVEALAVQADGRILVGGLFTTLGGGGTGTTSRHFLGRLGADGSLDSSFDPGADGGVSAIAVESNGRILVGGSFAALGGGGFGTTTRHRFGRINFDGSLDTSFDPGADGDVLSIVKQPDGEILVGGVFTTLGGGGTGMNARNRLGRLSTGGWLDTDLNPGAGGGFVEALALQPDGRILVGGNFTALGGGGTTPRSHVARLNPDGSLDASFDPGANSQVNTLVVQPDGKILVGGDFFTILGGAMRSGYGRLNADGSIDGSFDAGTNGFVYALAVQPDGKILVGGNFSFLGGGGAGFGTTPRNNLGRLNSDGSLDLDFNPDANGQVHAFALQPDGKILIGGNFTTLGGGLAVTRNRIARLNADGSLDLSFDPGANSTVHCLAVQPDGAILVGGAFTMLGGGGIGTTARSHIGRLTADGSLDSGFNPGANDIVKAISMQVDGKILVGGSFLTLGGGGTGTTGRDRIGRLHIDGSLDSGFNPGAGQGVHALVVQADGKILVGGAFTELGGGVGTTPRSYIGRLTNTGAAADGIAVTSGGGVVSWSRTGTGPEVGRATFEWSTDGATFTPLGSTTRVAGGWQLSGQSLPTQQNLFIRARGSYASGQFSGVSGSIIESIRNAYVSCPTITTTSLAAGTAGIPYAAALTTSGAIGVVAFGVTGGLPTGVSLGTSELAGIPLRFGNFPITLTAIDTLSGCIAAPQNLTLSIAEPTITLSATTFPVGTAGLTYPPTTITQSGGIGAATFAITGGALPNGVALSSGGLVSGTPVVFGAFNFTITATDVNGSTGSRAYALTIDEPTITLSETTFPRGVQDIVYPTTTITQTGGIGVATFAVTSGALPGGLALSSAGVLNGMPTATGVFTFTVTATDVNGSDGSRAYAVRVDPQSLPVWTRQPGSQTVPEGSTVTFTVSADGAPTPTLQWQVSTDQGTSWADLTDAAIYSGVSAETLTVRSAPEALTGTQYRAVATNIVGSAASDSATLAVTEVFLSRSADFDGDGRTDVTLFRPANGTWRIRNSGTGLDQSLTWGGAGDIPVAGDYDGDGRADIAVFRPSNGTWYIRNSSTGTMTSFLWGGVGDVPVQRDYDGDHRLDIAVFRESNGTWYIRHSSTGATFALVWGGVGDVAVAGDYDADGLSDIAVFRPSNGTWYLRYSSTGAAGGVLWGGGNDVPVQGDFDADGRTDVAVFRPSNGTWYIRNSNTGIDEGLLWGGLGDDPVPGDYDGDGKTDIAVFRPSSVTWYLRHSSSGAAAVIPWGKQ